MFMGVCVVCNTVFEPRIRQGGRPKKYCGEKCSRFASDQRALLKRRANRVVYNPECRNCKTVFETYIKNKVYCSFDCRMGYSPIVAHERWRKQHPRPEMYEYVCDRCGKSYLRENHVTGAAARNGRNCDECSLELKRMRYRRKSVTRRGYLSNVRVSVEQLVARDGSDCSICGEDIDILLPRTSKRGATIDHKIPLSKGGSDELENLQLAHWICNNWKADKVI